MNIAPLISFRRLTAVLIDMVMVDASDRGAGRVARGRHGGIERRGRSSRAIAGAKAIGE